MINQVTLVGRLTKDPDLRLTPDGTYVVNITLAVNRIFKNHHGEYETDFVQCTLWRKTAENTARYCKKGSVIGIIGKIHTRNYANSDGRKVYVTEVVAESVQFLSRKSADEKAPATDQNPLPQDVVIPTFQKEESNAPTPAHQAQSTHSSQSIPVQSTQAIPVPTGIG